MQLIKSFIFLISLSAFLISCTGGKKSVDDPILKEAFALHMEATEIEKKLSPLIDDLRNQKNGIQIQGRALSEEEMKFMDTVNNIEKIFSTWTDYRVEVPGFEHGHNHDGHQHHAGCNHKNDVQLTPQQMLEVQQESLKEIKDVKAKIDGMLKTD